MRLYYDSTPTEHSPNWTRVSAVVDFPDISSRNNINGICEVVLRDFEGALYPTWSARDLTRMKITDDAGTPNTIFRGILINKRFHDRDLLLEIAGIGIALKRRSFGADETKTYILASGFVKTLDANNRIHLQYKDSDDVFQDFTWDVDQWIVGDMDVGLMIKDTTEGYATKEWDCKDPIALAGTDVAVTGGDFDSTIDYMSAESPIEVYSAKDSNDMDFDMIITPTMDGDIIPNTKYIKEIEVQYNLRVKARIPGMGQVDFNSKLQILKDSDWITIAELPTIIDGLIINYTSEWVDALPTSLKEGSSPHIIRECGDHTELVKYLTDAGGNFTKLKGMRIKSSGYISAGDMTVEIDYLRVIVRYHTYDVEPVMYQITDNGASWVECDEVSNWQEMGITVDVDTFQIGENTRKIVQDIASFSGLAIDVINPAETTSNIEPNSDDTAEWDNKMIENIIPNADGATVDWNASAGDDWECVVDYDDGESISVADGDENKVTEINLTTLSNVDEVSSVTVYVHGKYLTTDLDITVDFYNGVGWEGPQNMSFESSHSWKTQVFGGLAMTQAHLNDAQVRVTANAAYGAMDATFIKGIYVKVTYKSSADHSTIITDENDITYIFAGDGDENSDDILSLTTVRGLRSASGVVLWVKGKYVNTDKNIWVYFHDGTEWHGPESMSFDNTFGWQSQAFSSLNMNKEAVNACKIKIKSNGAYGAGDETHISEAYLVVTYLPYGFQKYMARKFKGQHCIGPLKTVCNLEGAEWMEDYINNRLKLVKKEDFESSGVTITQADYDHDWEYEDLCNQVKYVYVWGKSSYNSSAKVTTNVFAMAFEDSVEGENSVQIIDDNIWTQPEAQEVADTQLALLKTKRPSIRIPLNGIQADLEMGTTVNVALSRPAIAATDYPIRMIQRRKRGKTEVQTIVYCGFGETDWDEKIIKAINLATNMAQRSLTDRLTSTPYDVGAGGIQWGDIEGGDIGAVAAVLADDAYLKNNANDTTTGNLTVANLITAGNVDGVDVSDLKAAFDALDYYTQAQVNTAVATKDTKEEAHAYIEATQLTMENDIIFNAGQTFDGKDVSGLCTEAEAHAFVEANALTLTADVTFNAGQTFDGKDVSGLCTDAEAHAYVEANALTMTQNITFNAGQLFDGVDVSGIAATVAAVEDRFDEQSAAFPGAPSEGDFHYDEDDDSLYRYNAEALAWVEVGAGGSVAGEVDNLGNHVATEAITGITRLQGAGALYLSPKNDLDDELVIDSNANNVFIYQELANWIDENGYIGRDTGMVMRPFMEVLAHDFFIDDGGFTFYQEHDDLQLIREMKAYEREKVVSPEFPDYKQKVFDVNTLPWIKAHPDVDAIPNGNNKKRYALGIHASTGFMLSAIKKLVEEIDIMKLKIKELEEK